MVDRRDALSRLLMQIRGTAWGRILATVLDAMGPLAPLGAQAVYSLGPLLSDQHEAWLDLGRTLEDPEDYARFIQALREGEGEEA